MATWLVMYLLIICLSTSISVYATPRPAVTQTLRLSICVAMDLRNSFVFVATFVLFMVATSRIKHDKTTSSKSHWTSWLFVCHLSSTGLWIYKSQMWNVTLAFVGCMICDPRIWPLWEPLWSCNSYQSSIAGNRNFGDWLEPHPHNHCLYKLNQKNVGTPVNLFRKRKLMQAIHFVVFFRERQHRNNMRVPQLHSCIELRTWMNMYIYIYIIIYNSYTGIYLISLSETGIQVLGQTYELTIFNCIGGADISAISHGQQFR